mgnify:CR=1 FL=1
MAAIKGGGVFMGVDGTGAYQSLLFGDNIAMSARDMTDDAKTLTLFILMLSSLCLRRRTPLRRAKLKVSTSINLSR